MMSRERSRFALVVCVATALLRRVRRISSRR